MAAAFTMIRSSQALKFACLKHVTRRPIATTPCTSGSDGWLFKKRSERAKEPHSRTLSDKEVIYELQTHDVRTDSADKYLKNCKETTALITSRKELNCDLVGSWTVSVGDLDQTLHLWRYSGGFRSVDKSKSILGKDESFLKLQRERGGYLRSRQSQFLLAFSYWPPIEPRKGSNIYEIRSYSLKPGTMMEWGICWQRGLRFRMNNNEPFAAFFVQVGKLNTVYHMWCYESLDQRKETRESAWRSPGWDECVAQTVPLIREMDSRILVPTEYSPTQ